MWEAFEKKITRVKDYNDRIFQQNSPSTQQYLKRHTQKAIYHTADFKGVAFSVDAENRTLPRRRTLTVLSFILSFKFRG